MLNTFEKASYENTYSIIHKDINYNILDNISIFDIIYKSNVLNDNLVLIMKSSITKVLIPEKEAN